MQKSSSVLRKKVNVSYKKTNKSVLLEDLPPVILKTAKDIISIKIQGATNVAIETFKALKIWLKEAKIDNRELLLAKYEFFANLLANARPTEPLAKNGVRYVMYHIRTEYFDVTDIAKIKQALIELSDKFLNLIAESKKKIVEKGIDYVKDAKIIFTHCHSSTAEKLIVEANKIKPKRVVATETRPLYQGRITVTNLLKQGVDTVMIVDGAAPYFIYDDKFLPVDVVLLGADEITVFGDTINKVGSYAMAISSYFKARPLYIVTPSLKIDLSTVYMPVKLELRDGKEIWKDAPEGLKIINPAFDLVPREFITGFITEFGLVKPSEMEDVVRRNYEWLS